jgi:hypothetical protein
LFSIDYTDSNGKEEKDALISLDEWNKINSDFTKWNKIMFNAYQTNMHIFTKLKEEITYLRAKLNVKNQLISNLTEQNRNLEKELASTRNRSLYLSDFNAVCNGSLIGLEKDDEEDTDLDKLIQELKLLTKPNREV